MPAVLAVMLLAVCSLLICLDFKCYGVMMMVGEHIFSTTTRYYTTYIGACEGSPRVSYVFVCGEKIVSVLRSCCIYCRLL